MKKELKDLTIQEFSEYNDMLNMDEPDIFGIFELFGIESPGQVRIRLSDAC